MRYQTVVRHVDAHRYPVNPDVYDNAAMHRWVAERGGQTEVRADAGEAFNVLRLYPGGAWGFVVPGRWIVSDAPGRFSIYSSEMFDQTFTPEFVPECSNVGGN